MHSFLALPLTTSGGHSAWKLPLGLVAGKPAFAVLSQLRNIDSRRLYQKIGSLNAEALHAVRAETFRMNATRPARSAKH
jgi:hypothetical protein